MLIFNVFLSSFILLLTIKHVKQWLRARKLPPGPRRLPLVGNLHQLVNPIHRSLLHLAKQHGPIMFLQLGSIPTLIISSADMLKEIFRKHDIVFSGRPVLYSASKFTYNCSDIVFLPYGETWREMRKIATIELLSAKRVQSFQAVREEEASLMLDTVARASGPINLSDLSMVLSNNVICRVALGRKYDGGFAGENAGLSELLREAQGLLGGFCIADFFSWMGWLCKFNGLEARVEKIFTELDKLYDKVIQEHLDSRRPKTQHEDFVDVLLRLQKDPSREAALSNDSIKGALTDMFIAGTDTSSATLVWTMAELIRNPHAMRRVQEEVRSVCEGKKRAQENDLPQLVYLKSVVKESLRVHPPAPLSVPRETIEDCKIGDYEIPARTMVYINALAISMDHKSWENPSEFLPERFLDSSIDFSGQHYEFIPFGVGRRGCPGMNFGVVLIEIALANLLHSYDWELPHGVSREDLDMQEAFGVTMHKKTPLWVVASGKPSYLHVFPS
uniref:Cytochrome P450 n=1 Tax=Manihot esculenta TaxID=3983 RepID=A0A2C9UJ75_MANES